MLLLVGIDPGTVTGLAMADPATGKLISVSSMDAFEAMEVIKSAKVMNTCGAAVTMLVVFEDARRHKVPSSRQLHKGSKFLQGVGSVKRDCNLWEGFLRKHEIPFVTKRPSARMTKWKAEQFARITGWSARTNNHGRDAALLVWNINQAMAESLWRQGRQKLAAAA